MASPTSSRQPPRTLPPLPKLNAPPSASPRASRASPALHRRHNQPSSGGNAGGKLQRQPEEDYLHLFSARNCSVGEAPQATMDHLAELPDYNSTQSPAPGARRPQPLSPGRGGVASTTSRGGGAPLQTGSPTSRTARRATAARLRLPPMAATPQHATTTTAPRRQRRRSQCTTRGPSARGPPLTVEELVAEASLLKASNVQRQRRVEVVVKEEILERADYILQERRAWHQLTKNYYTLLSALRAAQDAAASTSRTGHPLALEQQPPRQRRAAIRQQQQQQSPPTLDQQQQQKQRKRSGSSSSAVVVMETVLAEREEMHRSAIAYQWLKTIGKLEEGFTQDGAAAKARCAVRQRATNAAVRGAQKAAGELASAVIRDALERNTVSARIAVELVASAILTGSVKAELGHLATAVKRSAPTAAGSSGGSGGSTDRRYRGSGTFGAPPPLPARPTQLKEGVR